MERNADPTAEKERETKPLDNKKYLESDTMYSLPVLKSSPRMDRLISKKHNFFILTHTSQNWKYYARICVLKQFQNGFVKILKENWKCERNKNS